MRKKIQKNLQGMTLIELLVVVAIIGITTSIVLADWSGGRIEQSLMVGATEVEGVVREAQNYALTGYQGVANTKPCLFRFDPSGAGYIIEYWDNPSGTCQRNTTIRTYALKNGVTFSTNTNIDFTVPHAVSGNATQTISLVRSGVSAVVCVYVGGKIESFLRATCP
ncbi:MAG: type II secretion system protein [Candidatus Moranbacteria bacterium]|nr:type II secretion system protein [Candidatus Moranbacteria bacterium]